MLAHTEANSVVASITYPLLQGPALLIIAQALFSAQYEVSSKSVLYSSGSVTGRMAARSEGHSGVYLWVSALVRQVPAGLLRCLSVGGLGPNTNAAVGPVRAVVCKEALLGVRR